MDWTQSPGYVFQMPSDPDRSALRISKPGVGLVVEVDMDGNVTFGPGFTADEASKEAWKILGDNIGAVCPQPSQKK